MERGNSSAESVEKLLHLLDPEPRSPRHIDHREAVEDAAIIAALPADALRFREQANLLPVGAVRDAALRKARQAEAAAHMDDWLTSPGLQPPKKTDVPGPN